MAFDELRRDADTLATELGRDIQQALARFLDQVVAATAGEREALLARAEQEATEADVRIQNAVAEARREAEAALAALREESAAQLAAAVAQVREDADNEAAHLIARAKDEAALESAALLAQARDEVAKVQAALQQQDGQRDEALNRQGREREARLAEMERLLDGFRRLDSAATLTALLDTLSDVAAAEAARTALFLVRGRELQGWRADGFAGAPQQVRSLTLPLEAAGEVARPAQTRARAEVNAASIAPASPLAFLTPPSDSVGVAVPVIVGGQTAAILYADDGAAEGRVVPAGWPETLELLARHAARCLEAQTAIRAARLRSGAQPAAVARSTDTEIEQASLATGSAR